MNKLFDINFKEGDLVVVSNNNNVIIGVVKANSLAEVQGSNYNNVPYTYLKGKVNYYPVDEHNRKKIEDKKNLYSTYIMPYGTHNRVMKINSSVLEDDYKELAEVIINKVKGI